MFASRPALATVGAAFFVLVLSPAASAYAGDGLQHCLDKAADHDGDLPTCTEVNGKWVASWPDDGLGGGGSGGIVLLFVLGALIAIALVVWKVSTARKLAAQSGMDPGLATQMTLLTENGLDATYLAASLRKPVPDATTPTSASASTPAAGRLAELKSLLDTGLITQEEFDKRRLAIIDAV
jgi:hypothetical protein